MFKSESYIKDLLISADCEVKKTDRKPKKDYPDFICWVDGIRESPFYVEVKTPNCMQSIGQKIVSNELNKTHDVFIIDVFPNKSIIIYSVGLNRHIKEAYKRMKIIENTCDQTHAFH